MEQHRQSTFRWVVSTVISFLAAGGGAVALLTYFSGEDDEDADFELFPHFASSEPAEHSPPISLSLTGNWDSPQGLSYVIQQSGDTITFQEFGVFGVTAQGTGRIVGRTITVNYVVADGTQGSGVLEVSPEGSSISGSVTNGLTGISTPLVMYR